MYFKHIRNISHMKINFLVYFLNLKLFIKSDLLEIRTQIIFLVEFIQHINHFVFSVNDLK
jgi:hypothetical protein